MAKNLCDFVCNCPADNTAEQVTTALITKLRDEVEGLKILLMTYDLDPVTGDYIGKTEGRFLFRSEVLALLEKGGE